MHRYAEVVKNGCGYEKKHKTNKTPPSSIFVGYHNPRAPTTLKVGSDSSCSPSSTSVNNDGSMYWRGENEMQVGFCGGVILQHAEGIGGMLRGRW